MNLTSIAVLCSGAFFSTISVVAQSDSTLWYRQPAEYFEESLVLGNGTMGACVYGGVATDTIRLNDATLWSGEPVDPWMNPDAHTHLPAIREALRNGNYRLADSLNHLLQGSFSQSYAPLGTLLLKFDHAAPEATRFVRELNIHTAVASTTYQVADVHYTREYFVSHPGQVMMIRLSSSKPGTLNFKLVFESLLRYQTSGEGHLLEAHGYAPYHAEPNYRRNIEDAVRFDAQHGTRFTALIQVKNTDGTVSVDDGILQVSGASMAEICIALATSFNGFDKNPVTDGRDAGALAWRHLENAGAHSFDALRTAHVKDYQALFRRVHLSLGSSGAPDLPTDERLKRYSHGEEDKNLEVLYFQFGRYLLISSSRTPGVPANLQGVWNPYLRPPWSSNYTMNINLEENYWLAETANLSEMHMPLLEFIGNVATTGAVTAKTFYGAGGWTACHNSDIWAMSNPVGDFGHGDPKWANWNMAGAWLSTHLWEHYMFTQDMEFLRTKAYPLMKGAARFCLDMLIEDERGYLITSPSTSPENNYVTPEGYHGATLYGATADLAMIRELFNQTIRASEALGVDAGFKASLKEALARLYPYQIGRDGSLQEWYNDWVDADPRHRHQSHLFGLFPGHHITPATTPQIAEGCRVALEIKGDNTTGWSKGWRINLWARLLDGNRAYKMYRELLQYVEPDGKSPHGNRSGGTYPNLLDAHPPFQIDGNFGGAAAVVEMLLQSTEHVIVLLPALPEVWDHGSFSGVCARGGFEVTMEWQKGRPTHVNVFARQGGSTTLVFGSQMVQITLKKGQSADLDW